METACGVDFAEYGEDLRFPPRRDGRSFFKAGDGCYTALSWWVRTREPKQLSLSIEGKEKILARWRM